ncbi:hypothetical protein GGI05_007317, partial [Coemansia sp. RSA 2603]
GFKRLAVPSTAILGIALLYFVCVMLASQTALRSKLQHSIDVISATTNAPAEWFSWKTDVQNNHIAAAQDPAASTEEAEPIMPTLPLVRLPGWPSDFPDDLNDYRQSVLQNTSWASENEKHRAEIAPYVWHHRGPADSLDEQSRSADHETSQRAMREMARLGILPAPDRRANAYFVVLIRNRELNQFLPTLRQLEDRFNKRHHYPYLFLNDEPFSQRFMQFVAASTSSN